MVHPSPHHSVDGFDPHFSIFHELMRFKVREILLVSSPYDAYILEEDGSLASRIINEYHGLNLSHPPRITRVASPDEALELIEKEKFDLVVTMPHLGGMDSSDFCSRIKLRHPSIPVILLAHSVRDAAVMEHEPERSLPVDNTYVWCCDSEILLAIVKNVEDRVNVDFDASKAMVRVIILVEDSPLYRSTILPLLYRELVRQTQSVLDEGLNDKHRLLKMRARPKILTASTYEEAMDLFTRYRPYVFAVISDVRFPRKGKMDKNGGVHLLSAMRSEVPDLPLLMLSTDSCNKKRALRVPAVFAEKTAASLSEEIHDFFLRFLGFGDFIFRLGDGVEVGRAANLHEFERMLHRIPTESLFYHALNNHFSNWVMARAEVALASRLHKSHFVDMTDAKELRDDIIFKVHALRKLRQSGVVSMFHGSDYDPDITDFVRIGSGSMGGKARGVAFFASRIREAMHRDPLFAEYNVRIPKTCVVAANGFDDFVMVNELQPPTKRETDEEIAARFLAGSLPKWLEDDLRAFLSKTDHPLSVRSSSLLEDAQFRPYAGLYNTFMLLNDHQEFELRFRQLAQALKLVYASTWFAGPRAFSRSIGQMRKDSMAVIIQQLAGSRYGDYFYPALSGVAQSFNYYPVAPMRAEEGIAHIALGFGRTVVEGEQSLRFSPGFPENLPQFSTVDDILQNSQRWFYCLECSRSDTFVSQFSNLVRRDVDNAVTEFPVRLLTSTYSPDEQRIRDADLPGHKVVTFASVLKYGVYPLAEVLATILAFSKEGMGCEVEVEFCLDLHKDPKQSTFYFLQVRPIVTGSEAKSLQIHDTERKKSFCRSNRALGHGRYHSMRDIVYVDPLRFDAAHNREIARMIGELNGELHDQGRGYLLIGPGRWGTADPWLGIPVQWRDISGVGAIVELQGGGLRVEASQGSHFFQNITSLGIPYLMVDDSGGEGGGDFPEMIDWRYLKTLREVRETEYVKHVCLEKPFTLKVNGRFSEAVVYE